MDYCQVFPPSRTPIVTGKPSAYLFDCISDKYQTLVLAESRLHLDVSRTCIVGDRLDTDIAFGNMHNMSTLLVFTGVATRLDVKGKLVEDLWGASEIT